MLASIGEHIGHYRRGGFTYQAGWSQRPIAVAALEDKIVQRATAAVLSAIYEEDFLGFSYGFRPDAARTMRWMRSWSGSPATKVNWILDADIRSFFDTVSQEWLISLWNIASATDALSA